MFKIRYFVVTEDAIEYHETYLKNKKLGDIPIATVTKVEKTPNDKYPEKFSVHTAVSCQI